MSRYNELMEIFCSEDYRLRYVLAKNAYKCIRCGERIKNDVSPSDRLEYSVSALCPDCARAPGIEGIEDIDKNRNEARVLYQ